MRLELHKLCKSFGAHVVLDHVDFEADFGHALALIGPSGGGKSTLLRLLAGLEIPDSGRISFDGTTLQHDEKTLRAYRRSVGVVFQSFNLFPHLSALENILLPLEKVHGLPHAEARTRAENLLKRFGLSTHADKKPAALSGGQRQRVAIVRAVAARPRVLFFDEPTSALDPEMTGEVLDMIATLKAEGSTFVIATHEMGFAREVADQVAFVADGGIVEHAPAAEFFSSPRSKRVEAFLARILRY